MIFNDPPFNLTGIKLDQPNNPEGWDACKVKYSKFNDVLKYFQGNEYITKVIKAAPITGDRRFIAVDVKVQHLKANERTCLPGWHVDSTAKNLERGRPEINHLFVSGDSALTEFIVGPLEINGDNISMQDFRKKIDEENTPFISVPSCEYVTYGRSIHRGVVSKTDHTRLLIRISETDHVLPKPLVVR